MVTNVFERYYKAKAIFSGIKRNGALVMLISDSEAGFITYKAAVTFFAHKDAEDFSVSYDAYFEKELYRAPGRRSRKREAALLATLHEEMDALAAQHDAAVLWDKPLSDPRMG